MPVAEFASSRRDDSIHSAYEANLQSLGGGRALRNANENRRTALKAGMAASRTFLAASNGLHVSGREVRSPAASRAHQPVTQSTITNILYNFLELWRSPRSFKRLINHLPLR